MIRGRGMKKTNLKSQRLVKTNVESVVLEVNNTVINLRIIIHERKPLLIDAIDKDILEYIKQILIQ